MSTSSASRVISMFSAKGGVGKTFISINLAAAIHRQIKEPVCVVDMNTSYFSDLAKLTSNADGIKLFNQTTEPIESLLKNLKTYKYVIIDAGGMLTDRIVKAFSLSNVILMVATPDILSLNQTRSILDVLDRLRFPVATMVKVILNRAEAKGSLSSSDTKDFLPCDILGAIPSNGRLVGQAINSQRMIQDIEPKSNIAESFRRLAYTITNDQGIFTKQAEISLADLNIGDLKKTETMIDVSRQELSDYTQTLKSRRDAIIELKRKIHHALVDEMDLRHIDIYTITDPDKIKEFRQHAERVILHLLTQEGGFITSQGERDRLIREIADDALGLGPLEELLADAEVSDILVNNKDQIYVEKHGKLYLTDKRFLSNDHILTVLDKIISPLGRRIDESTPMVDARLPDGSRLNAVIPPISTKGPMISIRKFGIVKYTTDDLVKLDSLSADMAEFLRACIVAKKNIIVSGGTGSGKTTLLNVLSHFIPDNERIITIEDAVELNLNKEHWAALEARPPNIEGKGAITIRALFRNCMRMRPDRIIIGECRGDETLDMLQAMNTGHDGSLTTIHANSPKDAVSRLDTLVLMSNIDLPLRAVREQIASAIHMMVHTSRLTDGSRKVVAISEVAGMDKDADIIMRDIFIFQQTGVASDGEVLGEFKAAGYRPSFLDELKVKGIIIDEGMFITDEHR